jgi:hypothetical protein
LSEKEKRVVETLKARDREVRAHEAAHKAAAGGLAKGGANFSYEMGPDGQRYAVGGEVSIDTSPVAGDPEATLRKAETIRAAALAPAQPSGQDRGVAAQASQMAMEARAQITAQDTEGPDNPGQRSDNHPAIDAYQSSPASAEEASQALLNLVV